MNIQPTLSNPARHSHWLPLLILVGAALVFNWFYLTGGFQGDDIIFLNMFREDPLPFDRWRSPWSIDEHPCFERLWWVTETSFSGAFWRPVPGLVLEGSIRLFGERAFPLHLLSLLLHAGVTAAVYWLVFRLVRNRTLAFLAALFFVACEDHTINVGWIATITDLICVLAVLLSLLAWLRWLRTKTPLSMVFSLVALAVAMGSKESAATAPLALALLGILMPDGTPGSLEGRSLGAGLRRMWTGVSRWLPPLLLLGVYLVVYRAMGLGGMNSLMYVDPFSDPGRFVSHMAAHMPVMWLAALTPVPPSLVLFIPSLLVPLALCGGLAAAAFLIALYPFRRDTLVIWALLMFVGALIPQMGTDAAERLLYFPMVFGSILLALVAARIAPLALRLFISSPAAPLMTRVMGWWAMAIVLLPGVVLSATLPFYYLPSLEQPANDVGTVADHLDEVDQAVILVDGPNPFITLYVNDILTWKRSTPTEVWLLAAPSAKMSLERVSDASFVLSADRPGWLGNLFARIVRTETYLKRGAVYDRKYFSATLLELTADRKDVLAVRFDMKQPLDDRGVVFFRWAGDAYEPLDISALAMGKVMKLADTSDLWASM